MSSGQNLCCFISIATVCLYIIYPHACHVFQCEDSRLDRDERDLCHHHFRGCRRFVESCLLNLKFYVTRFSEIELPGMHYSECTTQRRFHKLAKFLKGLACTSLKISCEILNFSPHEN